MRLIRRTHTALLAFTALFPLASAHAFQRNLFTWSGTVDREVIIEVRGRDIHTQASGLDASFSPRLDINQALPRVDGVIRARLENGRGDVEVLENPSARNNYTARLRVRDTRAGADRYRVDVSFEALDGRAVDPRINPVYDPRNDPRVDPRNDPRTDPRTADGRNPSRPGDSGDRGNRDYGADRGNVDYGRDHAGDYGYDRGSNRPEYDHNRRDAGVLRWSGVVDGLAEIRIQGRRVDMSSPRGIPLRDVRYDVFGAPMPRHDVRLDLGHASGRGSIRVVQQPSNWNGYVAVIRIDDGRAGAGAYTFDLKW